nr:uncharacterized protein LOC108170617 isoform X2 [Malus domestica]
MAFSKNSSFFFLGSKTRGFPPKARINSDILGLSNLHLDCVTVDFQVRMVPSLLKTVVDSWLQREEEHKRKWPVLRTQGKTSNKRLKTLKSRRSTRTCTLGTIPWSLLSAAAHWLLLH